MSLTASITPGALHFNTNHATTAWKAAMRRYQADPSWVNALCSAWDHLKLTGWQWNGHSLITRSSDGQRRYVTTANGCECRAGLHNRVCWHMAALVVLRTAGELAQASNN